MLIVGHLRCKNSFCPRIQNLNHLDETSWDRLFINPLATSTLEEWRAFIACSHCNLRLKCIRTCLVKMLYVMHNSSDLTRVCVHVGRHAHHVLSSCYQQKWVGDDNVGACWEATTPPCLTSMNDFMSRLKNISSPNICIHVHFFKSPYAPN